MSKALSNQQFTLTLRPEGCRDDAEGYRRLKACLKSMLRSYGLRCVSVVTDQGTVTATSIVREGDK